MNAQFIPMWVLGITAIAAFFLFIMLRRYERRHAELKEMIRALRNRKTAPVLTRHAEKREIIQPRV